MRHIPFILIVSVAGTAVLLWLGFWQLARLDWKQGLIAEAEQMITAAPVALPAAPDPEQDRYRPVTVTGQFTDQEAHVLTSTRELGPGFRVLTGFVTTDGRKIVVDRGFVVQEAKTAPRPGHPATVTGNLLWPDDMTSATPDFDSRDQIWFGRDLPKIATALGAEPILVVASANTGDDIMAMPATASFKNDHLGYAITWFGLAAVWVGMTLGWLWRMRAAKA